MGSGLPRRSGTGGGVRTANGAAAGRLCAQVCVAVPGSRIQECSRPDMAASPTPAFSTANCCSRRHRPEALRHPNARLLGRALLCTLPVAAAQAVIAWLGLAVQSQGKPVEAYPRSLLGVFFASYWRGDARQCGASQAGGDPRLAECAACTFPAAAAIANALFATALLAALCVTSSRLAAAVLNQRLKRRMRAFQAAYTVLTTLGG